MDEAERVKRSLEGERMEKSAIRTVVVLGVLAIGVPLALGLLFERQARRLDALADHGVVVTATVYAVRTDRHGEWVDYAYEAEGRRHGWTVAWEDAPYAVGETFPAYYLPEDPSLTRPGADRTEAATEAAANRVLRSRVVLGIGWFFGAFALMAVVELLVLRHLGHRRYESASHLPARVRRRLVGTGVVLVPLLVAVFSWHVSNAAERGESMIGVTGGIVLSVAVIVGSFAYVLRDGPEHAAERGRGIVSIAAPIAIGVAVLRGLAMLFGL